MADSVGPAIPEPLQPIEPLGDSSEIGGQEPEKTDLEQKEEVKSKLPWEEHDYQTEVTKMGDIDIENKSHEEIKKLLRSGDGVKALKRTFGPDVFQLDIVVSGEIFEITMNQKEVGSLDAFLDKVLNNLDEIVAASKVSKNFVLNFDKKKMYDKTRHQTIRLWKDRRTSGGVFANDALQSYSKAMAKFHEFSLKKAKDGKFAKDVIRLREEAKALFNKGDAQAFLASKFGADMKQLQEIMQGMHLDDARDALAGKELPEPSEEKSKEAVGQIELTVEDPEIVDEDNVIDQKLVQLAKEFSTGEKSYNKYDIIYALHNKEFVVETAKNNPIFKDSVLELIVLTHERLGKIIDDKTNQLFEFDQKGVEDLRACKTLSIDIEKLEQEQAYQKDLIDALIGIESKVEEVKDKDLEDIANELDELTVEVEEEKD